MDLSREASILVAAMHADLRLAQDLPELVDQHRRCLPCLRKQLRLQIAETRVLMLHPLQQPLAQQYSSAAPRSIHCVVDLDSKESKCKHNEFDPPLHPQHSGRNRLVVLANDFLLQVKPLRVRLQSQLFCHATRSEMESQEMQKQLATPSLRQE